MHRINRRFNLVVMLAALAFSLGAYSAVQANDATATPTPSSATNTGIPWLNAYFTNVDPPDKLDNGFDKTVLPDIQAAKTTIDVTSFDFNLPSTINALVAAKKRGVAVRIIVDDKNGSLDYDDGHTDFKAVDVVKKAGIKVVGGGRSNGLMHNKIIIIDSTILYIGSWNESYNDTFRNNNNILRITSQKLIANYQAKFNEGYVNNLFGTHAKVGAITQSMMLDGVQVEDYLTPVDNVMSHLVAVASTAKTSIKFMIFTYTHDDLAQAMLKQAKAGVKIQGVIENRGASEGALPTLVCAKSKNLTVLTDGNKYTMHDKVMIIDDSIVVTGSFNWTNTADQANDDNMIVIHSPDLAKLYLAEFAKIYGAGKPPANVKCK